MDESTELELLRKLRDAIKAERTARDAVSLYKNQAAMIDYNRTKAATDAALAELGDS